MNKGWLELESDPGLFTLLLEDFGVNGVQVEEVYDLQKSIDGPVYGYIFLFRWTEERRCRRKTSTEVECSVKDDEAINKIFFAKQVIPDSCATHALLSVLLNCNKVKLGANLSRFKEFTQNMSPEDKGYAIGNMPELARAHNTYARPEPRHLPEKQPGISTGRTMEAFHFVSYVPINGHLYELDGLKPYPVDHGPWEKTEDWTEKFRRVISDRLGMPSGGEPASLQEIRFSLMAVVPDRRQVYEQKLQTLKINYGIVLEALQQRLESFSKAKNNPEGASTEEKLALEGRGTAMETSGSIEREGGPTSGSSTSTSGVSHSVPLSGRQAPALEKLETIEEDPKEEEEEGAQSSAPVGSQSTEVCGLLLLPSVGATSQGGDNSAADEKKPECFPLVPGTVTADVTKPLTIETKFGGSSGPSSESTDTASEVGSTFSSPGSFSMPSCHPSPHILMETHHMETQGVEGEEKGEGVAMEGVAGPEGTDGQQMKSRQRHKHSNHFTVKDLFDLLRNIENEIKVCEENLREEYEKRKKYKIDHCRRTHNYDKFILTFLTMLARQGKLAGLVEQNMASSKKRGVTASVNRLQPQPPAVTTAADKRRKARSRRRR